MTRTYEALVIVKAVGTDPEMQQSAMQAEALIKKLGGSVDQSRGMGRRRLAFRISRQTEGYYHLIEFTLPADQIEELKRQLRLNESVVRFLVLSRDPAAARPAESAAPATADRAGGEGVATRVGASAAASV